MQILDRKARYWLKIAIFPQLGDPRRNIAIGRAYAQHRVVRAAKNGCFSKNLFSRTAGYLSFLIAR